jgi:VanZ family protein
MRPLPGLIAYRSLVGLCAGGIFVLSSLPTPPLASSRDLPQLGKLCHALKYSELTCLPIRELCLRRPPRPCAALSLWATFLAVGDGSLDGFYQAFIPGRMMSLLRIVAHSTEARLAAGTWPIMQHRWPIPMGEEDLRQRRSGLYATDGILLFVWLRG